MATIAASREQIQEVQRLLIQLGQADVVADGELGPTTRHALESFQKQGGLPVTGEPDEATLAQLLEVTRRAQDADLSQSVHEVRAEVGSGSIDAWDIVEALLRMYDQYGAGGAPQILAVAPPSPSGKPKSVDAWLADVRTLYRPQPEGQLDGRKVIAGLAMLVPALHSHLSRGGFLEALEAEITALDGELSDAGRARRRSDAAPPLSDRPEHRDWLGRTPFVMLLAQVLKDEYELTKARAADGRREADSFMIHLEGPWGSGKSTLLNLLAEQLRLQDPPWLVATFNAWRNQRVGPPWWLLVKVVHRAALADRRIDAGTKFVLRARAVWWRVCLARHAIGWSVFAAVVLGALLAGGKLAANDPAGIALAALAALSATVGSARSLLSTFAAGLPRGSELFIRSTRDPMNTIRHRFQRMIRRIRRPVVIFIDDLDRCHSEYVVDLLEGIQTILRHAAVAYVVAADRRWLYDSYRELYKEHDTGNYDPGRPLGHLFLEKSFQLSASVPHLTDPKTYLNDLAHLRFDGAPLQAQTEARFAGLTTEEEILTEVATSQASRASDEQAIRQAAARRLATQELGQYAEHSLTRFAHLLEPNARSIKRLLNAYRPALLLRVLEGRPFETTAEKDAFVLWLIVTLRWPLLADFLAERPATADEILAGKLPAELLADTSRPYLGRMLGNEKAKKVLSGEGLDAALDTATLEGLLAEPSA